MTITKTHLEDYQSEISRLGEINLSLTQQVASLKEQLDWLKRQLFGQKSERLIDPTSPQQLTFEGFDKLVEEPEQEKQEIAGHTRAKTKRNGKYKITIPDNLPVVQQLIDIPEDSKVCSETGKKLVLIGEEVSVKLAHKPGSFYIKKIVRLKYGLPNGDGVLTPDLPSTLLDRCQADDSLLAEIIVRKYGDHLPLYRQSEIMAREGIQISRQQLCEWVLRAGKALKPLYNAMIDKVLKSGNVFYDETPVSMLEPGKGKTHQAYMWVLVGGAEKDPKLRIYDFCKDRCHYHAVDLLKGYGGILHSDKYGAYEALANKKQFTWCPCWSHIRRKFLEAESGDPAFRKWMLQQIRYLFMLEKVAWNRSEEERLRIRREKEEPIIDALIAAVKDKLINGKILPKSKLREALGYFCGLIPYLKNYLHHPWARLDNNVAERAVRPLAIGRKNWLFVGSEDGGEAAAALFSLIQTCRGCGLNPREYLEDVMRRLKDHNFSKLHELLPDEWIKSNF